MYTQIIDGLTTLTSWKMHNYKMWYIETNTKYYKKMSEKNWNEKVLK